MFPHIFGFILGYLIGSFPSAYVLVRRKMQLDIRDMGSGNVGTMNAFEVTNSKFLGIVTLMVDMMKGVIPVLICMMIWRTEFSVASVSGVGAIIGHNYPVWLRFRGGRGLATTAGIMLVLGPLFVVIWCLLWTASYLVSRHIHVSNILASVLSPILIVTLPYRLLHAVLPLYTSAAGSSSLVIVCCALILLRHIDAMRELAQSFLKQPL